MLSIEWKGTWTTLLAYSLVRAEATLQQLYYLNEQRRLTVEEFYEKLDQDPQPFAPYVCFTEAHKGILGLLAQRKLRRYVSYPEKMSRSIFLLTLRQKT